MDDKTNKSPGTVNEGEGNKTAAREYNEAQHRFTQSGKVEEKAREAEHAISGSEKDEMRDAETIGKRHSHGEDPAVKGKPAKTSA
ncbi:MAG TPA: hypothetical protein VHY35_16300 [Stellaceae bacterium]|jgi:hypothetical protein|nr:hypothetical protein [Stellaceae bacterium]